RRVQFLRNGAVWRHMRDYFPITLVKTTELDPRQNYLLGFHPHGVLATGAFLNFCTEASGFSKCFPDFRTVQDWMWFHLPTNQNRFSLGLKRRLVASDKESASHVLQRPGGGNLLAIIVGGAPEALVARVWNPRGSWLRWIQHRLQRVMGISLPLFHARGIFQYSFGFVPYRRPICTVVGKPIPVQKKQKPSEEEVDRVHEKYLNELSKLFEEHKAQYNVPADSHLEFI
ncbi:2-acylglycerol O-acyltransferase 2, partial [Manacus vitellinus]